MRSTYSYLSILLILFAFLTSTAQAEDSSSTIEEPANFMDDFDPGSPYAELMLDILEAEGFIEDISNDVAVEKVATTRCKAPLYIKVSLKRQRLYIYKNCSGSPTATWKVSTGTAGRRRTPPFEGRPNGRLVSKRYSSSKYPGGECGSYGNMAWGVFYKGGYAIHGTCAEHRLGKVASHGCTRIRRKNARALQRLVRQYGIRNTWISIR